MDPSLQSDKRQTLREIGLFAVLQLVCLAVMFGVFALLHRLSGKVLLGGAIGAAVTILNYFLTALGVWAAADKAEQGDVAGGKRIITLSMLGRFLLMGGLLLAGALSGYCDVIAMVIPLALMRPLIYAGEFFRRKDG